MLDFVRAFSAPWHPAASNPRRRREHAPCMAAASTAGRAPGSGRAAGCAADAAIDPSAAAGLRRGGRDGAAAALRMTLMEGPQPGEPPRVPFGTQHLSTQHSALSTQHSALSVPCCVDLEKSGVWLI